MFVTYTYMVKYPKLQIHPAAFQQHCCYKACVDAGNTEHQLNILQSQLATTCNELLARTA